MGEPMARHLLDAGHKLRVFTRTASKANALVDAGAVRCETLAEAVVDAQVICTMLGYPRDVRSIYLGAEGILECAKPDTLLIDFTTSAPSLAREIDAQAYALNLWSLDAPVSGGDVGAKNATLSIMAGGRKETFELAQPILARLGQTIVHQGDPGCGQQTKMVNQILIAGSMMGMIEALVYAERSGLDADRVLQSIGGGAAASWSLANLWPRIMNEDLAPGFYAEHFLKDLRIALEEAKRQDLQLPSLALAEELYSRLVTRGFGKEGTQALVRIYRSTQP